MRSYYQKDFSQDDNRNTKHALDRLKETDPAKYEEYMRLKMQQSWEEAHGGPAPLPVELKTAPAPEPEEQPAEIKKKPKRRKEPRVGDQIAISLNTKYNR